MQAVGETPGMKPVDIAMNRRTQKWTWKELALRLLWILALPFFRFSPRPMWAFRRFLLRLFGASVGRQVHVYPTVHVTIPWNIRVGDFSAIGNEAILYALGPIDIGSGVTVSQYAHLCAGTHDHLDPTMPLMKVPIRIGDGAWICADAFIGPGVTVGRAAIVGARAVAMKDVPDNAIVVGNPGVIVSSRLKNV